MLLPWVTSTSLSETDESGQLTSPAVKGIPAVGKFQPDKELTNKHHLHECRTIDCKWQLHQQRDWNR